jgi:hypothetical protein
MSDQAETATETRETGGGSRLTDTMARYLDGAAPWLRFVGILGFIFCGITFVVGIMVLITLSVSENFLFFDNFFGGVGKTFFSGTAKAVNYGITILYLGGAVLHFFPSKFIYTFGTKIRRFRRSHSAEDLELALKNNKSLWKFLGIVCVVAISFVLVTIILVIVTALVSILG